MKFIASGKMPCNDLFVRQGFFQPAKLVNGRVELIDQNEMAEGRVDDIIDEMIEKNLLSGGDTVIVKGEGLEKFNGLVLATRY